MSGNVTVSAMPPLWVRFVLRTWQGFMVAFILGMLFFMVGQKDLKPSDVSDWFIVVVVAVLTVNFLLPFAVSRKYPDIQFRTRRNP